MDNPKSHITPSESLVLLIANAQRPLQAYVFSLIQNAVDAHDVLQETNLILWKNGDQFEEGTNFMAWAYRIAEFQVMAYRKRLARSKLTFDDSLVQKLADPIESVEDFHESERRAAALSQCLGQLKSEARQLVAQRYQPDASVNAMALQRGVTPKALSATLRRIRDTLQVCIEHRLSMEASQ